MKIKKIRGPYTTGEAARLCQVSQQTIIRCFDAGDLGGFRVPRSKFRRIPRESLLRFMLEHGIPTDTLGMLTPEERAEIARAVSGPVKLTIERPDRGVGELLDECTRAAG